MELTDPATQKYPVVHFPEHAATVMAGHTAAIDSTLLPGVKHTTLVNSTVKV